jgi:hypothetical protein
VPNIRNASATLPLFPTVWADATTPDPPVGPTPVLPGVDLGVGGNRNDTPTYGWLYKQPTVDGQTNVPFWKGRLRTNDKVDADPGTGLVTWRHMDLRQANLDSFKKLHPDNPAVQAMTLDQLIAYGVGKTYAGDHVVGLPGGKPARSLTPCDWARVSLIIDVVCCITSFYALRTKINAASAARIADTIQPVLNDIEEIFETIHGDETTALQKAVAVKNLGALIWTGGLAEPIFKAMMDSLDLMDMCLYGTLGIAEIAAAFLTDFASVVAAVIAEMVLITFLGEDAIRWWNTCPRSS